MRVHSCPRLCPSRRTIRAPWRVSTQRGVPAALSSRHASRLSDRTLISPAVHSGRTSAHVFFFCSFVVRRPPWNASQSIFSTLQVYFSCYWSDCLLIILSLQHRDRKIYPEVETTTVTVAADGTPLIVGLNGLILGCGTSGAELDTSSNAPNKPWRRRLRAILWKLRSNISSYHRTKAHFCFSHASFFSSSIV